MLRDKDEQRVGLRAVSQQLLTFKHGIERLVILSGDVQTCCAFQSQIINTNALISRSAGSLHRWWRESRINAIDWWRDLSGSR